MVPSGLGLAILNIRKAGGSAPRSTPRNGYVAWGGGLLVGIKRINCNRVSVVVIHWFLRPFDGVTGLGVVCQLNRNVLKAGEIGLGNASPWVRKVVLSRVLKRKLAVRNNAVAVGVRGLKHHVKNLHIGRGGSVISEIVAIVLQKQIDIRVGSNT